MILMLAKNQAQDLTFNLVQESWIEAPALTLGLDSPNYTMRREAYERLRLMGAKALPDLVRASRSKDQEVAFAANSLIDRLFRCPNCKGTGRCVACPPGPYRTCQVCNYHLHCTMCKGSGDVRYEVVQSIYLDNDPETGEQLYTHVTAPRNIFMREVFTSERFVLFLDAISAIRFTSTGCTVYCGGVPYCLNTEETKMLKSLLNLKDK